MADVEQPLDQDEKISEYIGQARKLVEVVAAKVMAVTALVQEKEKEAIRLQVRGGSGPCTYTCVGVCVYVCIYWH